MLEIIKLSEEGVSIVEISYKLDLLCPITYQVVNAKQKFLKESAIPMST
jgi:hypothetical protein